MFRDVSEGSNSQFQAKPEESRSEGRMWPRDEISDATKDKITVVESKLYASLLLGPPGRMHGHRIFTKEIDPVHHFTLRLVRDDRGDDT